MRYAFLLIPLVAILVVACGGGGGQTQPTPTAEVQAPAPTPTTGLQPAPTATAPPGLPPEIGWEDILGTTVAPPGWSVAVCSPGEAPFLCVSSDGGTYGGCVELGVWPLDRLSDSFSDLAATSELEAVEAEAADLYRTIEEDRRGVNLVFRPLVLEEVSVGGLQGIRSGFSVFDSSGRLLERNVQYWAFDGAVLYVISAAAVDQPEVCEFTHGSLQLFEPYLAETAENLRFPRP